MADTSIQCSVITPESRVYEGLAETIIIPAHDGEIGILPGRAPLLCKLGSGSLRITAKNRQQRWFIDGGFARVSDNKVTVLTEQALRPEEIDRSEAEKMLEEARSMVVNDDIAARKKAQIESSARARLRLVR